MLSINWFRLIFIIKLIVITLATIQGAPIDIFEPPAITSSPNETQLPVIAFESFITENPFQQVDDNHVESQTVKDVISHVANFNGDQVMFTTSQQEISTETGIKANISIYHFGPQQTYPYTTPRTHMEAKEEKAKVNESSQNKNEILENTTEQNLSQSEKFTQSTIESETNNSQITKENAQNATEGNVLGNQNFTRETTKQVNLSNTEKPVIALESDNNNSHTTIENPQNTTEKNLPENPKLIEESTSQVNFNNNEKPVITLESGVINSQIANTTEGNIQGNTKLINKIKQENYNNIEKPVIALKSENKNSETKIENPQKTTEGKLPENQNLTREARKLENYVNNEKPANPFDIEIINSKIKIENPQNALEENPNLTEEPTNQVNFNNNEIPLTALESEFINSQTAIKNPLVTKGEYIIPNQNLTQKTIKHENFHINEESQIKLESETINSQATIDNFQNTTHENVLKYRNLSEETGERDTFIANEESQIALENEIINSQTTKKNFQNTTAETFIANQNFTQVTTEQVNYHINEKPGIAFKSENISSQNENFQNTTGKVLLENQSSTSTQANLDVYETPLIPLESKKINSQNENKSFQNTTEIESVEDQSSTKETSTQIIFDITDIPLIALDSEIVNSQTISENIHNTTDENSQENPNLADETSEKLLIDNDNAPIITIASEIVNSQIQNENLPKATADISTEKMNLTAEIPKHVNFKTTENFHNVIESENINYEKELLQNTTQKNMPANQSSPKETLTQMNANNSEKAQIPLESVILGFQNEKENLQDAQIEILTGNSELVKATTKQSDLPLENHKNHSNINGFTQNINLQKLTDKIEESVQNIVKESEENLFKRESNENLHSHFINENFQYSEQIEKTDNEMKLNNVENEFSDINKNSENSKERLLIEERQAKLEKEEGQNFADHTTSESTRPLSTTENLRFLKDPKDLSIEQKHDQNLADLQISETTNIPLTTTENAQNILDIISREDSFTTEGVGKEIVEEEKLNATRDLATDGKNSQQSTVNASWDVDTANTNSQSTTEYLQRPRILPSTQKSMENTVTATNSYLQTVEQMLHVDKSNSQFATENPQNTPFNISAKRNAVDEQITTASSLYNDESHQPKLEVETFSSHLLFPNTENVKLNSLVESQPGVAQNVEKLTTENINLQNSPELNDNMMTRILSEYVQNSFNNTTAETVVTEQNSETDKHMKEKYPFIYQVATILPNVEQNLSNLLENQSYMTQESSTMSSDEETTEKISNATTQRNINENSNASVENPGFLTFTENVDVARSNFHTTNFNTQDDLKMSSSSKGEDLSTESGRLNTGTAFNWNTEKSVVEEITTGGGDTTTARILVSFSEAETTTPKTMPVERKAVEETTVSVIPKIPLSTEGAIEFNQQDAFKSFVETRDGNESVEGTTIFTILDTSTSPPAAETTIAFATTEGGSEEPIVTTNRDRNSYIRSTTNSQFASLLEETEMNVHKAFETLREWIASGTKSDETTKNPAQMDEEATTKFPINTDPRETVETATTKNNSEPRNTLNTTTLQEESFSTFTMNSAELGNSTLSPLVDPILSSEVEHFSYTTDKLEKLQVKEHLQRSHDEITIMTELEEGSTLMTGKENLPDVSQIPTQSDKEAVTVKPSLKRVKLQKDMTAIILSFLNNSSEEVVSENPTIEKKSEVIQITKAENEKEVNHNRNVMNVKFFNKENTILYQPTPVTFYQEMVKFIQRETTETPKSETQNQVPLTQASFMEEQQQQIESTTESAIRFENTTLEGPNDITTLREMNVNNSNVTTEERLTTIQLQTTNTGLSTTELHSTITELPATTNLPGTTELHTTPELPQTTDLTKTTDFPATTDHILETTITTDEDTTSTTDAPELATTTLIVPGEPEGRSLDLPPPKLEYIQNEDGVEVFYGYSIVKHN